MTSCSAATGVPERPPCSANAGRSAVPEVGGVLEAARVLEGAEEHVDQRQIGIVLRVYAARVVDRVALRALHEVPQPARRAQVGVLEDPEEGDHQDRRRRGGRRQAEQRQHHAGHQGPADDVERVEPERAVDVEPLGAVVHLVQDPDPGVNAVHATVVGIGEQLVDEQAERGGGPGGPAGQVEELQRRERIGPEQRQVGPQ